MNPILNELREQIRHVESGGRIDVGDVVKNGCPAIDRLLPQQGYPRGSLVQWITRGGQGADYLSLRVAQQACLREGALVIIDPLNQFFPPAAAAMGINLDHLIVLRTDQTHAIQAVPALSGPPTANGPRATARRSVDLLWAIDQSLRCPAVAAVWGPIAEIDERWFRRFQLSAESSGCVGLFIQPPIAAQRPTWAEVQWRVSQHVTETSRRSPLQKKPPGEISATHLQLTRCRGTPTGKSIQVTIDPVTGNIQPLRRPHEIPANVHSTSNPTLGQTLGQTPTHRLPVAAPLVDPTLGRRRA